MQLIFIKPKFYTVKIIKSLLAILFVFAISLNAEAQLKKLNFKSTSGKLFQYGQQATARTTDSTLTYLDTLVIASNEAGIIELQIIGYDSVNSVAITGSQIVRYKKVAGTLTLGTATDVLATEVDTGLQTAGVGGAAFTIISQNNNVVIRVKGKDGKFIHWIGTTRKLFRTPTS